MHCKGRATANTLFVQTARTPSRLYCSLQIVPMKMHFLPLYLTAILARFVLTTSPERSPFLQPYFEPSFDIAIHDSHILDKRQNNCPAGATSCSNLGNSGACCASNTNCQLDQAGHVACCPSGASCTGTIGANTGSSTQASTTTSNAFIVPTSTNQVNPQVTATGVSTVPNAFFPFVFLPATFSNAAGCSSYYSSCQTEYNSCTASLGGTVNGVTVSGLGGGVTVAGSTPTVQAQSICSSLSSQACSNVQLANCNTYGTAAVASVTLINPNAAPSRCPGSFYGVGVGLALGVAGQVLG